MRTFIAVILYLIGGALTSHANDDVAPTLSDLLADQVFWGPDLSPSGTYLAIIRSLDENKDGVLIIDLENASLAPAVIPVTEGKIAWVEWVTDERVMFSVTLSSSLGLPVSRLVSANRDGSDPVILFEGQRSMLRNYNLAHVTDFLPEDPEHVLVPAWKNGKYSLFKVNVLTGEASKIAGGSANTYAWLTDKNGEPAFRLNINRRRTRVTVFARHTRDNGTYRWHRIASVRLDERTQQQEQGFKALAAGPLDNTYYVSMQPDGQDTAGIYLYNFVEDEIVEEVISHPVRDIRSIFTNRHTGEYVGASYWDDRLKIEYADADIQNHLDALDEYFGSEANIVPVDVNTDSKVWLLFVFGPRDRGSYHVYYRDDMHVSEIGTPWTALEGKRLSEVDIIQYTARDGLEITGYLTRPAASPENARAPLILMPHGGPESRDYYIFHRQAQWLASLGYQVFQPNFRGSAGYGSAFADAGRKEWGGAMQNDLTDAVQFLTSSGIADAGNVCIMGASYGGYAALAGATLTPDLYQCAIAIAPVTDLERQLRWERREFGRDSETLAYWQAHMGDLNEDAEMLETRSPARLSDQIQVPILLVHGERDNIVPYEQSTLMVRALKRSGKPYEFLSFETAGHSWRNSEDERTEFETIQRFLAEHLPVSRTDVE